MPNRQKIQMVKLSALFIGFSLIKEKIVNFKGDSKLIVDF